ncbi:MAG: SURF1 family cytochrome oxidase biogenesis protein [Hyphomicrobiales bacterium]|nr:SURF1 family cytochrome oxidase biogenesis protein [Hyphomicrobiales bacterium]
MRVQSMRKRGLLWPAIMTALALPVLLGLGAWQIQRLQWKNGVLDELRATIAAVNSGGKIDEMGEGASFAEFNFTQISGVFDHSKEKYVFTSRDGQIGYLIFTPLAQPGCSGGECEVWINRGFVPQEFRELRARPAGQTSGEAKIRGMVRRPEKNAWFTPSPDTARNIWYATSFLSAPYIEADATPNPGGWPRGRDPKSLFTSIPNNHAAYAFTWFSLAAVLAIMFGVYAYSRRDTNA